ncbi:MAG: hypothetical protein ACJAUG_000319 [Halioglobus sp.]|jgi:hypothetical protein
MTVTNSGKLELIAITVEPLTDQHLAASGQPGVSISHHILNHPAKVIKQEIFTASDITMYSVEIITRNFI